MLSPAILKENVDGEALDWAARRPSQHPKRRKILIVLSDGAPVDQATIDRNGDKALPDRHLREVIAQIGSTGGIELCVVGFRHDVSACYQVRRRVGQIPDLADAVVNQLDRHLFSDRR
ncbi:hypothetical protein AVO45_18420 [Ruegeria marisrubri]|uniref:Cobalamin biosynthesis protein CobT VWA domain-containing protein n=2 Tax=Ruegeria marisrubri TaxID=1685379 RepID=A0A0X3U7G7_9RHOB|nr:hypothetical protein AVO45_18420 [Ruegeria marisrubri]